MTKLHTIVYLSTAAMPLSEADLEKLLLDARAHNRQNSITGVLLYSGLYFMQCIEGPQTALRSTFERVKRSSKHKGIVTLLDSTTKTRQFSKWAMGFVQPTESELLQLSNAQWTKAMAGKKAASPGFRMLSAFWNSKLPLRGMP
jgi:Sensors of blue-light using FAD